MPSDPHLRSGRRSAAGSTRRPRVELLSGEWTNTKRCRYPYRYCSRGDCGVWSRLKQIPFGMGCRLGCMTGHLDCGCSSTPDPGCKPDIFLVFHAMDANLELHREDGRNTNGQVKHVRLRGAGFPTRRVQTGGGRKLARLLWHAMDMVSSHVRRRGQNPSPASGVKIRPGSESGNCIRGVAHCRPQWDFLASVVCKSKDGAPSSRNLALWFQYGNCC